MTLKIKSRQVTDSLVVVAFQLFFDKTPKKAFIIAVFNINQNSH